jgi:hypothetical protein
MINTKTDPPKPVPNGNNPIIKPFAEGIAYSIILSIFITVGVCILIIVFLLRHFHIL